MKRFFIAVAFLAMGFVIPVPYAIAQDGPTGPRTTLSTPVTGTTVNRIFTIAGTTSPDCPVYISIDGFPYFSPDMRSQNVPDAGGSEGPFAAQSDANGRFSITMDLNGKQVVRDTEPPETGPEGVTAGPHTFATGAVFCQGADRDEGAKLTLTVQDQPAPARTQNQPPPQVTPSVPLVTSPSPSVQPLGDETEVAAENTKPDPVLLFVFGTLLGASVLALAEYSAKWYHAKHPHRR